MVPRCTCLQSTSDELAEVIAKADEDPPKNTLQLFRRKFRKIKSNFKNVNSHYKKINSNFKYGNAKLKKRNEQFKKD